MNYSEGPWEVCVFTDETIVEGKYQTVAASVSNCDADLIAAAPDLYEALKQLCSEVNDLDLCSAPAYALAAIAKAEGRNND